MKQKLKVSVDLPQPIQLKQEDNIVLYLPDASGAFITVHGDGIVHYHGNGHGAPVFAINLVELGRQVRASLH